MKPLFETLSVTSHTKYITTGTTFVAIKGMKQDGVQYIPEALARGATCIIVDQASVVSADMQQACQRNNVPIVVVENPRKSLAEMSAKAHGYPAQQLYIIGITGTKGKTTTTFLTEHILRTAGYKTALLSTVKNSIDGVDYSTELTTQQPDYIHAFLAECVRQGVTHVVMEVAAQAVSLYRVHGILFDQVLFMNFSHEHGEFYATQGEYFAAKAALLQYVKPNGTVLLTDDDERIAHLEVVGTKKIIVQHRAQAYESSLQGIYFTYNGNSYSCSSLFGPFNVCNARFACAVAEQCGVTSVDIYQAFKTFTRVPGRLDRYLLPNGALGCIDYAHNPASFEAILSMLREYTDLLIVVFGAGGDRDTSKRSVMGAIAVQYGDVLVLTSDNPRSEDPCCIVDDIMEGIQPAQQHKVYIELDRERAILKAYELSEKGAIIALLGKGPDEYQIIKDEKIYFSEREILKNLFM